MRWTFLQFMEHIENMNAQAGETPAMQAIRTGLNQSDDFWDAFLAVCNSGDQLADLLDVPATKVGTWRSRITESLQKVQQADKQPDESNEKDTKKTVLPTGDDDQLADPAGVEVPQNGPIDTRPY